MLTNRLGGWIGALILGTMSFAPGVHAEIWAYIDADGAVHLATEPLDERYQLFYKGKTSADVAKAAAQASRTNVEALRSTAIYKRLVGHPNVERFKPLIDRNARAHGLDPALVRAVIAVESAFDPQAVPPDEMIRRIAAHHPIRDLFVENPPIETLIARLYKNETGA